MKCESLRYVTMTHDIAMKDDEILLNPSRRRIAIFSALLFWTKNVNLARRHSVATRTGV